MYYSLEDLKEARRREDQAAAIAALCLQNDSIEGFGVSIY